MKKYITYLSLLALLTACSDHAAVKRNFLLDSTLKHNNEIVDKSAYYTIMEMKATTEEKPTAKPIANAAESIFNKVEPILKKVAEIRTTIANVKGIYLYDGEYHHESIESRKAKYEKEGFIKFEMTSNR